MFSQLHQPSMSPLPNQSLEAAGISSPDPGTALKTF